MDLEAERCPAPLRASKPPVVQFPAGFLATHTTICSAMQDNYTEYVSQQTLALIKAKEAERDFYKRGSTAANYLPALYEILTMMYQHLLADQLVPTRRIGDDLDVLAERDNVPPHIRGTYESFRQELPTLGVKVVLLSRAKVTALIAQQNKKKELKNAADVMMTDLSSKDTISKLVDKRVKQALRTNKVQKGVWTARIRGPELTLSSPIRAHPHRSRQRQEGEETAPSKRCHREEQIPTREELLAAVGLEEAEIKDVARSTFWEQISEEEVREEVISFLQQVRNGSALYDSPATYPNFVTELPMEWGAAVIIRMLCPVQYLQHSLFLHTVHYGPDVIFEMEDIKYLRELSVGWKYMLPQNANHSLIPSAWEDLKDCLRWRLHFTETTLFNDEMPTPFDPDYDVPRLRKPFNQEQNYLLEWALRNGDRYVDSVTTACQAKGSGKAKIPPTIKAIQNWITSRGYVVTPTDKNLGACVVTSTWLDTETRKLIFGRNTGYRALEEGEASNILAYKIRELKQSMDVIKDALHDDDTKQLMRYLGQHLPIKVTPEGIQLSQHNITGQIKLPSFYGIPKVHKKPIKMRPIAPCHSALQNPLAKFVSKILKPFVAVESSICNGTKELALDLTGLQLPKFVPLWLVGGDIVAYYPNIDVGRAVAMVTCLTDIYDHGHVMPGNSILRRITRAQWSDILTTALSNLVVEHNGLPFLQTKGIAMGVACSPDIANIYAIPADKEILSHPAVLFYRRYIDDIFAVIQAPSAHEALDIAKNNWHLEGCSIDWATPGKNLIFLDMFINLDEHNTVQWRPYRKPGNHLERVPWDSAHPYDVKRGTFIRELSRLAVLSTKRYTYMTAATDLAALYLSRGYPDCVIRKWLNDHLHTRWENQFAIKADNDEKDVIVLKTHFNDAWNDFSISELLRHISRPLKAVRNSWEKGDFVISNDEEHPLRRWQFRLPFFPQPASFPPDAFPLLDRATVQRDLWHEFEGDVVFGKVTYLDLQTLLVDNAKWVVSRKRTKRLGDLAVLWKKSVLSTFREVEPGPDAYTLIQGIDAEHRRKRNMDREAMDAAESLMYSAGFTVADCICGPPRSVGILQAPPPSLVQDWLKRFNATWEDPEPNRQRRHTARD